MAFYHSNIWCMHVWHIMQVLMFFLFKHGLITREKVNFQTKVKMGPVLGKMVHLCDTPSSELEIYQMTTNIFQES